MHTEDGILQWEIWQLQRLGRREEGNEESEELRHQWAGYLRDIEEDMQAWSLKEAQDKVFQLYLKIGKALPAV